MRKNCYQKGSIKKQRCGWVARSWVDRERKPASSPRRTTVSMTFQSMVVSLNEISRGLSAVVDILSGICYSSGPTGLYMISVVGS